MNLTSFAINLGADRIFMCDDTPKSIKVSTRQQAIDAAVRRFPYPFEMLEHYRCNVTSDLKKQDKLMKKYVISGTIHKNICAEFRRIMNDWFENVRV